MTGHEELIEALPQKPPFRFVDALESVDPLNGAVGRVTFPAGHPVFDGHLPGDPVVPGVILIEALAQLSGVVSMPPGRGSARGFLAEVRRMRFRRLVRPEETVVLHSTLERRLGSAASFAVAATVAGAVAAEGSLVVGGMAR